MLTGLIRSKTIVSFLLSYLISGVMLGFQFYKGQVKGGSEDLLFTHWALSWLQPNSSAIPMICLALAIGALVFGRIRFREVKSSLAESNLGMVVMASVMATQWKPLFTRPDVLVSAIILMGLFMLLFSTYKRESVLSEMFHIGLLLGFAALFVGQSILLVLSVAFSLLILRTGNWKEWFVFFLGIVMTLVFVALFLVWNDTPFLAFQRMIQTSWVGSLTTERLTSGHLLLAVLVVVSFSSVLKDLTSGTVHERNITLVNVGWMLGVFLMAAVLGLGWQAGFILAAFPLSTLISRSLESINRWWLADLLLLTILSAPFLSSLWPL